MKKMTKFLISLLLFWTVVSPMTVLADIGPKPSVVIEFVGLEDEIYYATLLSETDSTGPWSAGGEYYDYMGDKEVFQRFCEYEDADGYYFLSYMENCSEDDTLEWTYYPPSPFKILVYFPEYDVFWQVDEIYEKYAFDSYFTVEVTNVEDIVAAGTADAVHITAKEDYDFLPEMISLIARVIITIAIEVVIALLFMYRDRKAITIITLTNVFTQVILNVLLNIINYKSGQAAFMLNYIWMEGVIFVIEGVIYDKIIGRVNSKTNKEYHPYWYAAVANAVSLGIGIYIARNMPGIF